MDNPHGPVGSDHPVFHVIARPPAQSSCGGLSHSRPVLWMNQFQPALMPLRHLGGLNSKNPAKRVRKQHPIGFEVPLPPAKVRDPLCLFQPSTHYGS